ncbi:MAG: alpha/beta hydrolase [Planctomycetota bacterium]|jgi:esterase/lipase superfamily enzyme
MPRPFPRRLLRLPLVALVLVACTGCGKGPALVPTPALFPATGLDPFDEVSPELRETTVEMLFATDRLPDNEEGEPLRYGFRRSNSGAIGTCTVRLGDEDLDWDGLVAASTAARRERDVPIAVTEIVELVRIPDLGPMVQVGDELVDNPEVMAERNRLIPEAASLLTERVRAAGQKDVFVYVHGYNNTFEDAALRLAQLWHFMGRRGVPFLYTWPAGRGGLRGYTYDRESGEFTVFHLKNFLREIGALPEVENVHVLAHSRGTDVFMTALRELNLEFQGAGRDTKEALKLGRVVLAAPDLDWEVTVQRITNERIGYIPDRLTIYLSKEDKAIGLASWLFGSVRRLGQLEQTDLGPVRAGLLAPLKRIDIIDVTAETGFLGHGYFIGDPSVLSDLILVLRDGRPPGAEHGRPLRLQGVFWVLDNTYPTFDEETLARLRAEFGDQE